MDSMYIHHIEAIETEVVEMQVGRRLVWTRHIEIEKEDGQKVRLALFSDKKKSLELK